MRKYFEFVRFSHTVFALPFALASMMIAARENRGWPGWGIFLLILAAMICARTAAMGFNRLVDQRYDAQNPRTAARHLPAGKISRLEAWILVAISAAGLIVAAWSINWVCFVLSPVALGIVFFYSLTKRFTDWTHLFLGLALAVAPIGAWLAVTGQFAWPPLVLGLAVVFWLTGFDIIYATQDHDFDQQAGLRSLPVRLGIDGSLRLARWVHVAMWVGLLGFGLLARLNWPYYSGLIGIAGLLVYQHRLAQRGDPVSVNVAALRMNGIISLVFLVAVMIDVVMRHG